MGTVSTAFRILAASTTESKASQTPAKSSSAFSLTTRPRAEATKTMMISDQRSLVEGFLSQIKLSPTTNTNNKTETIDNKKNKTEPTMAIRVNLSDTALGYLHNEGRFLVNNNGPAYRDEDGYIVWNDNPNDEKLRVTNKLATVLNDLIGELTAHPIPARAIDSLILHGPSMEHKIVLRRLAPYWHDIINCAIFVDSSFEDRVNNRTTFLDSTKIGYPIRNMIEDLENHPIRENSFEEHMEDFPDERNDPDVLWDYITGTGGSTEKNNILFRLTKMIQETLTKCP